MTSIRWPSLLRASLDGIGFALTLVTIAACIWVYFG